MTISSQTRKAGPYIGAGTTSTFPFAFKVFQASDVLVVKLDTATNIETTLTLTSNYTVSLNADQNSNPGGNITLVGGALATGYNLVISSKVPYTQGTDITNMGGFYPEVIEDALDKLTIETQQLKDAVDRSAKLPITSTADADALVADIVRIADSADNLDIVANNIDNVNTVADDIADVNTVAGNISNVNTVAGISADVTTVAGNTTNINTVAANNSNVSTVATNIGSVNTVAANVTSVATNAANISSINTNATNIVAIQGASANAATATEQAGIATTQAGIATTQATNAANSAAQAAASAASGMYSAVQDKSANYTVVAADAGDLIRVDSSGGARTITLPQIGSTGIGDGFKIAVVKWTGDGNAVTIQRSGSDTINGGTSYVIGAQYTSVTFVADAETSQWFAAASGLGTSNVVVDAFNGTGSQTAFTLSGDPGSENNTQVFVAGVYQEKDTYSVSGTTLTFSAAPPSGTGNIEVVWSAPLAIGTPSDGTVTTVKLADTAVTPAKLDRAYAELAAAQSFTKAQRGAVVALTDGATITPDFSAGNNFSVTLGGNRTLANPTNIVAGQSGVISITQDGTGSRTLAFGSYFKFASGSAPTLTATASAVDDLAYYVESATRIAVKQIGDVK